MNYTLNAKLDAYATDAGPVIKKTMIDLPECTINQEDPKTRVQFMVAMLQSGSWGLFYAQGGDWNAFADGDEHNAEMLSDWMPDAIRDCVAAVAERIGESAAEDMDWFTEWADAAEETLSASNNEDSRDA